MIEAPLTVFVLADVQCELILVKLEEGKEQASTCELLAHQLMQEPCFPALRIARMRQRVDGSSVVRFTRPD
jgi:hypothetical protein